MIKGVGHIGIVVKDIDAALAGLAKALGGPKPPVKDVPERKMKVAVWDFGGFQLEFLQDYSPDGWLAGFNREHGNAIHHFCLLSDDLDGDVAGLHARGVDTLTPEPRNGLRGKRIIFLSPELMDGFPVELSEP